MAWYENEEMSALLNDYGKVLRDVLVAGVANSHEFDSLGYPEKTAVMRHGDNDSLASLEITGGYLDFLDGDKASAAQETWATAQETPAEDWWDEVVAPWWNDGGTGTTYTIQVPPIASEDDY